MESKGSVYNISVYAGYWDRTANHITEALQYLGSLEEMTGEKQPHIYTLLTAAQSIVSAERAKWQARLPRGEG
jgi:hypothetical protein